VKLWVRERNFHFNVCKKASVRSYFLLLRVVLKFYGSINLFTNVLSNLVIIRYNCLKYAGISRKIESDLTLLLYVGVSERSRNHGKWNLFISFVQNAGYCLRR
jgi:hypothetical protein